MKIEIRDDRRQFRPGDQLEGSAKWLLSLPPESVELRLFWYTRGKGTQDAEVVETVRFDPPHQEDSRTFSLKLPQAPYSFSGKLISLVWALELLAKPNDETERVEIVVSPAGDEILLQR